MSRRDVLCLGTPDPQDIVATNRKTYKRNTHLSVPTRFCRKYLLNLWRSSSKYLDDHLLRGNVPQQTSQLVLRLLHPARGSERQLYDQPSCSTEERSLQLCVYDGPTTPLHNSFTSSFDRIFSCRNERLIASLQSSHTLNQYKETYALTIPILCSGPTASCNVPFQNSRTK